MVLDDRDLTVKQIAKPIGISSGLIHTILTEILGMSKLSARWILRMLTPEYKLKRVDISRTLLTCFQVNPKSFHCRLVTKDESWIHFFKPKSKIQSK